MTRNQECAKFLFGQVHKEATPFEKCVQAQDARGFQGRMPSSAKRSHSRNSHQNGQNYMDFDSNSFNVRKGIWTLFVKWAQMLAFREAGGKL